MHPLSNEEIPVSDISCLKDCLLHLLSDKETPASTISNRLHHSLPYPFVFSYSKQLL